MRTFTYISNMEHVYAKNIRKEFEIELTSQTAAENDPIVGANYIFFRI